MTSTRDEAGCAIHASCVLVGEAGILIRGPSGAGKSTLAASLVEEARRTGRHGGLVGDDRVRLSVRHGRLIARPVAAIAGLIEVRGLGLRRVPHDGAAVIRLVVDLVADRPARLPDPAAITLRLLGIDLPLVEALRDDAARLVAWRLRGNHDTVVTKL